MRARLVGTSDLGMSAIVQILIMERDASVPLVSMPPPALAAFHWL